MLGEKCDSDIECQLGEHSLTQLRTDDYLFQHLTDIKCIHNNNSRNNNNNKNENFGTRTCQCTDDKSVQVKLAILNVNVCLPRGKDCEKWLALDLVIFLYY